MLNNIQTSQIKQASSMGNSNAKLLKVMGAGSPIKNYLAGMNPKQTLRDDQSNQSSKITLSTSQYHQSSKKCISQTNSRQNSKAAGSSNGTTNLKIISSSHTLNRGKMQDINSKKSKQMTRILNLDNIENQSQNIPIQSIINTTMQEDFQINKLQGETKTESNTVRNSKSKSKFTPKSSKNSSKRTLQNYHPYPTTLQSTKNDHTQKSSSTQINVGGIMPQNYLTHQSQYNTQPNQFISTFSQTLNSASLASFLQERDLKSNKDGLKNYRQSEQYGKIRGNNSTKKGPQQLFAVNCGNLSARTQRKAPSKELINSPISKSPVQMEETMKNQTVNISNFLSHSTTFDRSTKGSPGSNFYQQIIKKELQQRQLDTKNITINSKKLNSTTLSAKAKKRPSFSLQGSPYTFLQQAQSQFSDALTANLKIVQNQEKIALTKGKINLQDSEKNQNNSISATYLPNLKETARKSSLSLVNSPSNKLLNEIIRQLPEKPSQDKLDKSQIFLSQTPHILTSKSASGIGSINQAAPVNSTRTSLVKKQPISFSQASSPLPTKTSTCKLNSNLNSSQNQIQTYKQSQQKQYKKYLKVDLDRTMNDLNVDAQSQFNMMGKYQQNSSGQNVDQGKQQFFPHQIKVVEVQSAGDNTFQRGQSFDFKSESQDGDYFQSIIRNEFINEDYPSREVPRDFQIHRSPNLSSNLNFIELKSLTHRSKGNENSQILLLESSNQTHSSSSSLSSTSTDQNNLMKNKNNQNSKQFKSEVEQKYIIKNIHLGRPQTQSEFSNQLQQPSSLENFSGWSATNLKIQLETKKLSTLSQNPQGDVTQENRKMPKKFKETENDTITISRRKRQDRIKIIEYDAASAFDSLAGDYQNLNQTNQQYQQVQVQLVQNFESSQNIYKSQKPKRSDNIILYNEQMGKVEQQPSSKPPKLSRLDNLIKPSDENLIFSLVSQTSCSELNDKEGQSFNCVDEHNSLSHLEKIKKKRQITILHERVDDSKRAGSLKQGAQDLVFDNQSEPIINLMKCELSPESMVTHTIQQSLFDQQSSYSPNNSSHHSQQPSRISFKLNPIDIGSHIDEYSPQPHHYHRVYFPVDLSTHHHYDHHNQPTDSHSQMGRKTLNNLDSKHQNLLQENQMNYLQLPYMRRQPKSSLSSLNHYSGGLIDSNHNYIDEQRINAIHQQQYNNNDPSSKDQFYKYSTFRSKTNTPDCQRRRSLHSSTGPNRLESHQNLIQNQINKDNINNIEEHHEIPNRSSLNIEHFGFGSNVSGSNNNNSVVLGNSPLRFLSSTNKLQLNHQESVCSNNDGLVHKNTELQKQNSKYQDSIRDKDAQIIGLKEENLKLRTLLNFMLQTKLNNN